MGNHYFPLKEFVYSGGQDYDSSLTILFNYWFQGLLDCNSSSLAFSRSKKL